MFDPSILASLTQALQQNPDMFAQMMGGMGLPGFGGPSAPEKPKLSVEDKLARRKKQRDQRKARKRNRS